MNHKMLLQKYGIPAWHINNVI